KLIASYSKKCGLPGYSSVQYSVSVESELTTIEDVAAESARVYALLQTNVDAQIQNHGFVPPDGFGMEAGKTGSNGNGHISNGEAGNGQHRRSESWNCTEGQRTLILRIVEENRLDKNLVEQIAQELFSVGVRACDKLQASQLIEELFERTGKGK